jgi:glycosyltransferase involved in cell wall biosynthesis
MGKAHDFDTILQVARELSNDRDIAFVFVGEGPKRDIIVRFIRENPRSNVILLPYRSRDELSTSLGAADVSLVSLADSMEGLVVPSKVYGAMAAGRPLIFIGPGGSEAAKTIVEAECGYVLENGDAAGLRAAILSLKTDNDLARRMGRNSRLNFEKNFDRRLITRRYFDLIKDVVEKSSNTIHSRPYVASQTTEL